MTTVLKSTIKVLMMESGALNDEQKVRLQELLDTDAPLAEIAQEMGMSYHTLRLRMAEDGLRIRRVLVDTRALERIEAVPVAASAQKVAA